MTFFSKCRLQRGASKVYNRTLISYERSSSLINVSFMCPESRTKKSKVLGTENPRLVQEHKLYNAKIILWCGNYPNGVLHPYYFDNETVRGTDYYELPDSCVRISRHFFHKTICSNRMECRIMFSVLFLIHCFLILGS